MKPLQNPCLIALLLPALLAGQGPGRDQVDDEAVKFFLEEGLERSQVMDHLSWICDVYGPRVTGSPNLRKAQQWATERFGSFGYEARTEAWGPFGRGWRCDHINMEVTGDNPWPVLAYAKVWSPGFEGRVEAEVVHIAALTAEQLEAMPLGGKIVLIEDPREVSEPFDGTSKRLDAEELLTMANQKRAEALAPAARAASARQNDFRMGFQRRRQMMEIVQKKRPLAIIDRSSKGDYGTVFVQGASALPQEGQSVRAQHIGAEVIPQFTIAVEHYNRMCRILQKGIPVRLALELRTTFFTDDLNDYNVLADIGGADPAIGGQFAMLGAHFDSWQSGTGATDNGCGSAVVMEAARLIAAWIEKSGNKPRRTVRACLWSGEEQGLLGSRGYVSQHLGSREELLPEQGLVSGYFNLDNGTGKVRGVYLQGNEAVAPIFRAWLRPFHVHDASTLTLDDTGGTDHLAFHAVGVPGFQFIQDPVSYGTRTHHSNMDNWDHAVAADLMQASVVMATFVWQTAQREEMLPRHEIPQGGGRGRGRGR
ncbi:MAG: M28 family peptidase [Planctomycetes bacterium]|nr:M28 family peptidase [Planctomycetota bacterium]